MSRRTESGFALALLLLMGATAFAAEAPTVHQVYEAAQAGRLSEAQGMIQQVLKEHPDSAKAHYVDAELLAKVGHATEAQDELKTAERLEPGLSFVKAQAVQELKVRIDEISRSPGASIVSQHTQGGFPWGWVFLGAGMLAVIAFIVRMMAKQNAAPTVYPANYQGSVAPGGYVPGAQGGPGLGSNILSGLATGAALGAGMVAGEELVRHLTEGDANTVANNPPMTDAWETDPNRQMGGMDFGMADNSSWDDGSNLADISGGDDWT
jgi:hypothetical protein